MALEIQGRELFAFVIFGQGIFKEGPVLFETSIKAVGKELTYCVGYVLAKCFQICLVVQIHFVRWAIGPFRLDSDVKQDNIMVTHAWFNLDVRDKGGNRGQDQIQSLEGC